MLHYGLVKGDHRSILSVFQALRILISFVNSNKLSEVMYFVHIVLKLTSLLHGHTQSLSFSLLQLRVRIFIENNLLFDSVLDHFLRTPHVIEHFSYIFTKRIDKKLILIVYSSYES